MSGIDAKMVKELREKTGAGMMDCKKALTEAGGDMEKAIDALRKKGLSQAAKKTTKPDEQYVLLRKAAELACDGGDAGLMLETVGLTKEAAAIDAASQRVRSCMTFSRRRLRSPSCGYSSSDFASSTSRRSMASRGVAAAASS